MSRVRALAALCGLVWAAACGHAAWAQQVNQAGGPLSGGTIAGTVTPTGTSAPLQLADELAHLITPENFGAAGNGTADDTTAMTSCFATLDCNIALDRTYLVCNVPVPNGANITGAAAAQYNLGSPAPSRVAPRLLANTSTCNHTGDAVLKLNGTYYSNISGLIIDGNDILMNRATLTGGVTCVQGGSYHSQFTRMTLLGCEYGFGGVNASGAILYTNVATLIDVSAINDFSYGIGHLIDSTVSLGEVTSAGNVGGDNANLFVLGGTITSGDVVTVSWTGVSGTSAAYTVQPGDTITSVATGVAAAMNANSGLSAAGVIAAGVGTEVSVYWPNTATPVFAGSVSGAATEYLTVTGIGDCIQEGGNSTNFIGVRAEFCYGFGYNLYSSFDVQITGGLADNNTWCGIYVSDTYRDAISNVILRKNGINNGVTRQNGNLCLDGLATNVAIDNLMTYALTPPGGSGAVPQYAIAFTGAYASTSNNITITGGDCTGYTVSALSATWPTAIGTINGCNGTPTSAGAASFTSLTDTALSTAGLVANSSAGVLSTVTALPAGTTATTQAANDNTTKVATNAFVNGQFGINIQTFPSNGTWTKPSFCSIVTCVTRARIIGSGGPGGGGGMDPLGTAVSGGAGGASGSCLDVTIPTSSLGATQPVVVASTAQPGGAGATSNGAGSTGTQGSYSSFGGYYAWGGGAGAAGNTGASSGGGASASLSGNGNSGSGATAGSANNFQGGVAGGLDAPGVVNPYGPQNASGSGSGASNIGNAAPAAPCDGSGASGAGLSATTAAAGGTGGAVPGAAAAAGGASATSGTAGAGGGPTMSTALFPATSGTGGGGSNSGGTGGPGGGYTSSGYGCGGAGGGAGTAGGGNGGAGCPGYVVVVTDAS